MDTRKNGIVIKGIEAGNWTIGCIGGFDFWVKHFELPSRFGINSGRISKLSIRRSGTTKDLVSYDRGWDVHPGSDAALQAAYKAILARFN